MGRGSLPSIDGIVSAIEVVTNPDKYLAYLAEIQQAYSKAKEAMGDVDTKGKLEACAEQLAARQLAFEKTVSEIQAKITADTDKLAVQIGEFEHQQEIAARQADTLAVKHDEALREIAKRYAEQDAYVKKVDAEFAARNAEFAHKEQALAEREVKLDATMKKIAPVAAALGVSLE